MSASLGTFGQFGIGTADPVDKRLNYESEDFTRKDEVIDGNGIRGTRSSDIELVRDSLQRIDGPVSLIPTAVELGYLLDWIMGGTGALGVYPLGDTLATRYVTIDRKTKVFKYTGVGVNKATFKASRGTALKVELDLVGQTSTVANSGTFPAIELDITTKPFIFSDLTITVNGTTVSTNEFEVSVDNKIDKDRYFNSLNLTAVNALDREVMFKSSLPYGDHEAIRAAMNAGAGGLAVVATFTNGNTSVAFTLPAVAVPMREPPTPGRVELMLPVEGRAYRKGRGTGGDARELTVALDNTP